MTVSMVAWTLGVALFGFQLTAFGAAGDVVKGCNAADVFMVLADGQTIAKFTDPGIYAQWRKPDWSDIGQCLTDLSGFKNTGDTVEIKTGTLVKADAGSADVYLTVGSMTLRKIADWDAFISKGWMSGQIYKVKAGEIAKYKMGDPITKDTPSADVRKGAIIKYAGSKDVYYVKDGKKHLVPNETAFFSNFASFKGVVTVADTESYDMGDQITAADSSINRPMGTGSTDGGGTVTPPSGNSLKVSIAPDTRATTMVTDGEGEIYTSVLLTAGTDGPVRVKSLKVKRVGDSGARADFISMFLLVDGVRRSNTKSINTDDEANLDVSIAGENYVEIPAGGTTRFDIAANIVGIGLSNGETQQAAGDSGHINTLAVVGVTAESAVTVTGLPTSGNPQIIAGVNAHPLDISYRGSGTTVSIGQAQTQLGEFKFSNQSSTKDMYLKAFTIRNNAATGTSADAADITNLKLSNGATEIATAKMANGRYVHFKFDPILIEKGGSKSVTFTVKGDIIGGPGEYVQFTFADDSDIYGFITPGDGRTANEIQAGTAAEYTIQGGTLTISKSADSPVLQTIVDNQNNVIVLRSNLIAADGEVEVEDFNVRLTGSILGGGGSTSEIKTMRVYLTDPGGSNRQNITDTSTVNVATVANGITHATAVTAFSDNFTFKGTKVLVVELDFSQVVATRTVSAGVGNGGVADFIVKRTSDSAAVAESGNALGEQFTVVGNATATTAISDSPVSSTKVQGETGVEFLGFTVKADNEASPIKLTKVILTLVGTSGTAVNSDVGSVKLYGSDSTTVYAENPTISGLKYTFTSFTSAMPTTINQNGIKLVVKGNISASVTSGITALRFQIGAATDIEADDINNEDVTMAGTANTGSTVLITIASRGRLDVELRNDEVLGRQLLANSGSGNGSDAATVARMRFTAQDETVKIKKLILTLASATGANLKRVYLYDKDAAKVLASTSVITSSTTVTFEGLGENILPGTSKKRTFDILVDTNSTGTGGGATTDSAIRFQVADASTDIEGRGAINQVYAAPLTASGTKGVVIAAAGTQAVATDITAIISAATTSLIVTGVTNTFRVGNLALVQVHGGGVACGGTLATTAEYMLIEAVSGGTMTVRRGVAGTTALASHLATADVSECKTTYQANTSKLYAAAIAVSDPSTKPSGSFSAWNSFTEVFKFKITPDAKSEEDAVLNSIAFSLKSADGIGATTATQWWVDQARIKNGAGTVLKTIGNASGTITSAGSSISATVAGTLILGSSDAFLVGQYITVLQDGARTNVASAKITANNTATETLTISAATVLVGALPTLAGDNDTINDDISHGTAKLQFGNGGGTDALGDSIASTGETYSVEIIIGGTVGDLGKDVMQMAITDYGSINAGGTVTDGDVAWDDSKSTNITWLVTPTGSDPDDVNGGVFEKSAN